MLIAVFGVVLGGGLVRMTVGGLGAVRSTAADVGFQAAMLRAGASDPAFSGLVARVRAEPGFVLADPPDVVVLANRPVVFEPLIYSMLLEQGSWRPDPGGPDDLSW